MSKYTIIYLKSTNMQDRPYAMYICVYMYDKYPNVLTFKKKKNGYSFYSNQSA